VHNFNGKRSNNNVRQCSQTSMIGGDTQVIIVYTSDSIIASFPVKFVHGGPYLDLLCATDFALIVCKSLPPCTNLAGKVSPDKGPPCTNLTGQEAIISPK